MLIGTDVHMAAEKLGQGGIVAIPTETVYGLAANAYDREAVIRIFEAKQRPLFNPLIVHTADVASVHHFAGSFSEPMRALAEAFWPGPLTMLLPRKEIIHPIVTAGSPLVAVRIPDHPLTQSLLKALPFPLAAPSANLFGTVSPTTALHVAGQFGDTLDYILDGGPCRVGIESTIVKEENGRIVILRPGGVTAEQMGTILGYLPERQSDNSDRPEAPGMLKSHYAPSIRMTIGDIAASIRAHASKRVAVLSFRNTYSGNNITEQIVLSPDGDLHKAAQALFGALKTLETADADLILAEFVPDTGIGIAINDRLRRASA